MSVGGGIGMGNTCKPLAVSFQCMTKSTTNKKKKNGKKRIRNIPAAKSAGKWDFCVFCFFSAECRHLVLGRKRKTVR